MIAGASSTPKNVDLVAPGAVAPRGWTRIIMILDRSGSMAGSEADVMGGFNTFVARCRAAGIPRCTLSYVRFDTEVEKVFTANLADVPELTGALYAPRGSTALLDAVGMTVSALTGDPEDSLIVITFTDGEENSSREWTKEKVAALLKQRKALGNWTFAFFGADIDAWAEAGGMGHDVGNVMGHSRQATRDMMAASARVASVMASRGLSQSLDFATATQAVLNEPDLSDEQIARQLEGEAESAHSD